MGCRIYAKSVENIQYGFKRTGIYTLDPTAISSEYLSPAEVYGDVSDTDSQATVGEVNVDSVDNSILSSKTPGKNNF